MYSIWNKPLHVFDIYKEMNSISSDLSLKIESANDGYDDGLAGSPWHEIKKVVSAQCMCVSAHVFTNVCYLGVQVFLCTCDTPILDPVIPLLNPQDSLKRGRLKTRWATLSEAQSPHTRLRLSSWEQFTLFKSKVPSSLCVCMCVWTLLYNSS